jgi:hypothetical protein
VPDAFYGGPNGVLWIEYKFLQKLPIRDTTQIKVNLSPLQVNWLTQLSECHQNAVAIVAIGANAVILRAPFWCGTITKQRFLDDAMSKKQIANFICTQCIGPDYESERTNRGTKSKANLEPETKRNAGQPKSSS